MGIIPLCLAYKALGPSSALSKYMGPEGLIELPNVRLLTSFPRTPGLVGSCRKHCLQTLELSPKEDVNHSHSYAAEIQNLKCHLSEELSTLKFKEIHGST